MEDEKIIGLVRRWVESFVVELNLCPFANRELLKNRVRFVVTRSITGEQLLVALQTELEHLNNDKSVETTLLVHPQVLQNFYDYNEFLSVADSLLVEMNLVGVYQIASFHPDYQFGGTDPADAENYTNRSPYPMLHLLREDGLEQAIANYPGVERITARNIARMNGMGRDKLKAIMKSLEK